MKKILFFGSFFLLSFPAFAASFPDVPQDHKNYEAVEYLDEKGIINGYADGTFGPSNLVNRAEALKMIVNALNVKHDETYDILFPDVKKEDWFFPYVMGAQKEKIVGGYKDGKFKPGDPVNLAETLKMILSASKVKFPIVSEDIYTDVKKTDWFASYMLYARNHNIILSDDYGAVHPDQSMTRSAFAEVIYRTLIVMENKEQAFPLDKDWDSYDSKTLPFKMKYDSNWFTLTENENEVIFFKPDKEFLQFSPIRTYPNSAVVRVTLDTNDLNTTKVQYFTNIKSAFPKAKYEEFKFFDLNGLKVIYPNQKTTDLYIYLLNGDVLVVYTQYGDGILAYQLEQFINAMTKSLEYKEVKVDQKDYSALLSEIFEGILVEGKGMELLNKLPDKQIIETDAIGVGTGPVDYYYSEEVDYTFKYERAADVILDKREGQTSAF